MKHDILVFDLDGTLCPVGKGMREEDAALLRTLEDAGFTIVICSGKTTYYLCGFCRQLGLKAPVMVGENGGAVQFGIDLPPKHFAQYPVPSAQKEILGMLRREIDAVCGDRVWYQPNEVQLTPFPQEEEVFGIIRGILEKHREELAGIEVYEQIDCFDIVPSGINKQNGLRFLSTLMEAERERFLVVGDGVNDIPMFAFGDFSILVRKERNTEGFEEAEVDLVMPDIYEAMQYILEHEQ